MKRKSIHSGLSLLAATAALIGVTWSIQAADPESSPPATGQQTKKPNIVMLMTDDTGWNDFGAYSGGGAALGHPTPNIDRIAKEGAMFTNWYGQASCTAGRASFITGRIPIRSALSIVVAPGDENALRKETPTIAEFFQKNGYSTYFSGKWHLGDKPDVLPDRARLRRDEGVRRVLSGRLHLRRHLQVVPSVVPLVQPGVREGVLRRREHVRMGRRGRATGEERRSTSPTTTWPTFDVRQADYAVEYIKKHAKDDKPFFMDVNFMKMHNPTNAAPKFAGKSRLGDYSDSMLELDDDIGRIMDAIRAEAPNTIVIVTADNGAWQDAYPDAGTTPFRGEKGTAFEGGWRVPGLMWWPGHIPAGAKYDEMMSHIDCWATLATMVGLTPPPHGAMDGQQWQADLLRQHRQQRLHPRARRSTLPARSWIYIDGESFMGVRADIGGDPKQPRCQHRVEISVDGQGHVARPEAEPGRDRRGLQPHHGSVREIRHDLQRRGVGTPGPESSPGKYAGQDNGWVLALIFPVVMEFNKSIVKYPSIKRYPGRSLERLQAQSSGAEQPRALDGYEKSAKDERRRRLGHCFFISETCGPLVRGGSRKARETRAHQRQFSLAHSVVTGKSGDHSP